MASKTPLLLILDGLLSRDEARVDSAVHEIRKELIQCGQALWLPVHERSSADVPADVLFAIEELLRVKPEIASIPSDHDGSLPLHFAASLGSVEVAAYIFSKVRMRIRDLHMQSILHTHAFHSTQPLPRFPTKRERLRCTMQRAKVILLWSSSL